VSILSSMSGGWNQRAKLGLKVVGLLLFAFALLIAAGLTHSTIHGYMGWLFWSSGSVAVDGSRRGYVHINTQPSRVIITRTDSNPRPSYPAFPIRVVNPPCSIINGADFSTADNPIVGTLKAGRRSVAVQTIEGRRGLRALVKNRAAQICAPVSVKANFASYTAITRGHDEA
jgi:hypothetical protein